MKLEPTLERSAVALGKNEKAAKIVNPQVAPEIRLYVSIAGAPHLLPAWLGLSVDEFIVGSGQ